RPSYGTTDLGADENSINQVKEIHSDRVNFQKRYISARRVLSSTISGPEVIRQLDKKNSYDAPIDIVPVTPEELLPYHYGGLSGIRKREADQKYEILVNVDLTVDGIAHGVAEALELLKVAYDEDHFHLQNESEDKALHSKLDEAHASIVQGKFNE